MEDKQIILFEEGNHPSAETNIILPTARAGEIVSTTGKDERWEFNNKEQQAKGFFPRL